MNATLRLFGDAWGGTRRFRPVLLLLAVMFPAFAILQSAFLTATNLESMLANAAVLWVISMGMTFVLLSGGFDLSVGAIAALAGIFMAKALQAGIPGGVVLAMVVAFGALVGGLINGVLVGKGGLSVFVVTLASMISLTGVVDFWSGSKSIYVTAPIGRTLGIDDLFGVPMPIWIMGAVFLVALYVQKKTFFGRDIYAIGGSPIAAKLAGVRLPATLIAVYALMGACAALAGAIGVGRIGAAVPQVNNTLPLEAIAAVLLGGTALTGGAGGVTGTALGVLFIAVLDNGLSLSGVSNDLQNIVTGVILVAAVTSDRLQLRLNRKRRGGVGSGSEDPLVVSGSPPQATQGAVIGGAE